MADNTRIPIPGNFQYSDSTVEVVGEYNLNRNGEVINIDNAEYRYYIPWDGTNIDLLEGYDNQQNPFVGREGDVALFELLKWIMVRKYSLSNNNINFVTKRGILRSIAATVNDEYSKWQFKVCRHKDIIYIGYNQNPKEEENKRMPRPLYASTFFMGSRTDKNSDLFAYHVAKCNFKRIKCLIAGEVKCKVEGQNDFVELKGTTIYNFAKNSYKGWLQAYLLGNQSVSYGLRSGYILEDVKKLRVVDIPEKHASWDGCAMLGFLHSVLQELQERIPEGATCTLKCNLNVNRSYYITVDDNDSVFLNTEFMDYVNADN